MAKASKGTALALPFQQRLKEMREGKAAVINLSNNDRISTKGAKFSLDGKVLGTELNAVVLSWCFEQSYYDSAFSDEGNIPVCYAVGYDGKNMEPASNCVDKMAASCAECDLSKWIDDEKPKCTLRYRLAIMIEVNDEPVAKWLSIPPTSLGNWRELVKAVENQGIDLIEAALSISFDKKSDSAYPPIKFEMLNVVKGKKQLDVLMELLPKGQTMIETGYDPSFYKGATGGKSKAKPAAPKKRSKMSR